MNLKVSSTLDLLGIVFIVLKLTGVIDWKWDAVLAPFWIPPVIVIVALVVGFIVG